MCTSSDFKTMAVIRCDESFLRLGFCGAAWSRKWITSLVFLLALLPAFLSAAKTDEQLLMDALLFDYNTASRPVYNASKIVTVKFGLTLTQISDMDEVNQVLTINVWLEQEWDDERLTWDPKDYNGLEILRIPCEKLWLPDIVLYNSADDFTTGYMKSKAMVHYSGNVFWPPPAKFRSSCKIDITYFPFDDQVCELKFGSWTYDGFQVDVTNRSATVDLENYVFSGEWELIDVLVRRTEVYYACCDEPYPDVRFTIIIRRKTLYYLFNIIFPCLWLTILSLLGFWLPPDSGEKITLGITVLLAFSVFMLLIAESMPATSEFVPLIGIYLTVTMAMTSLSIILTVFVLQLHHVGPHQKRVPRWMWTLVIEVLAPIVCLCHVSQRYRYVSLQKAARNDSRRQNKHQNKEGGDIHMNTFSVDPTSPVDGNATGEAGGGRRGGGGLGRERGNCNGILVGGAGVDNRGRCRGGGGGGRGDRNMAGVQLGLPAGAPNGSGNVAADKGSDVERKSYFGGGSDVEGRGSDVVGGMWPSISESLSQTGASESGVVSNYNSGLGVSAGLSSTHTSVSLRHPPANRGELFTIGGGGPARRDPVSRPGEYLGSARNSRGSQGSQPRLDRRSCDSESFGHPPQGVGESAVGTSLVSSVSSEAHKQTLPKLSEWDSSKDTTTLTTPPARDTSFFRDPHPHALPYPAEEKFQSQNPPSSLARDRDSILGQAPPGYQPRTPGAATAPLPPNQRTTAGGERQNERIAQHLQVLVTREDEDDYHQDVVTEWRVVAHVMDRLLFWLFLLVAVVSSVIILIIKPLTKPEPWRDMHNSSSSVIR